MVKVYGDAPGTAGAPSKLQVNGAVPDNAVAVMVPLEAPGHEVAVLVALPVMPAPAATVSNKITLQLRLSVIVMV